MTDPFTRTSLQQIRWDFWSTNRKTKTSYVWPKSKYDSVTNYHVRIFNLTINSDDHETIEVTNTDLETHCTINQRVCKTGARQGVIIWGSNLPVQGHIKCIDRQYGPEPCILTNTTIRCIQSNVVISNLFESVGCARRLALMRLVLTNDTTDQVLRNSQDFVPLSSDFNNLFADFHEFYQTNLSVLGIQYDMCPKISYWERRGWMQVRYEWE